MEREIIKLPRELIAPILCPDIFEEEEYDKYFKIDSDKDPDLSKEEWNIWNNFTIVEQNVIYSEPGSSYEIFDTIVKRLSDNTYFVGRWSINTRSVTEFSSELMQVFPKEKTITVYE